MATTLGIFGENDEPPGCWLDNIIESSIITPYYSLQVEHLTEKVFQFSNPTPQLIGRPSNNTILDRLCKVYAEKKNEEVVKAGKVSNGHGTGDVDADQDSNSRFWVCLQVGYPQILWLIIIFPYFLSHIFPIGMAVVRYPSLTDAGHDAGGQKSCRRQQGSGIGWPSCGGTIF